MPSSAVASSRDIRAGLQMRTVCLSCVREQPGILCCVNMVRFMSKLVGGNPRYLTLCGWVCRLTMCSAACLVQRLARLWPQLVLHPAIFQVAGIRPGVSIHFLFSSFWAVHYPVQPLPLSGELKTILAAALVSCGLPFCTCRGFLFPPHPPRGIPAVAESLSWPALPLNQPCATRAAPSTH